MKKSKIRTIESLKSRYGMLFVTPWLIGMLIFFIIPIGQSLWFSFCKVGVTADGIVTKYIGFKNYDTLLNKHPKYTTFLTESISSIFYLLPAIIIISMILAIVLNGKFKGRIFFRALYFLPVIIASGIVVELLFAVESDFANAGVSAEVSSNMISFDDVINKLGLPLEIIGYLQIVLNNVFNIIWNTGIQIVLFLAGLQSIPAQLYEVSKVEGCSKWEEFWYITFPLLSRTVVLVIVFTTVELLTTKSNKIMALAYTTLNNLEYGIGSAMLWFYFIIIGTVLGLVMLLFQRTCLKRWE